MSMARAMWWYSRDGTRTMAGSVGRLEIAERALHRLEAEAGMLEVEEDEIAAGRFQDVADAGRGELDDEMAEFRRLAAGHGLEALICHPFLPLFGAALSARAR